MTEQAVLQLKKRLRTTAAKKFPGDKERQDRYVWGTLARIKRR